MAGPGDSLLLHRSIEFLLGTRVEQQHSWTGAPGIDVGRIGEQLRLGSHGERGGGGRGAGLFPYFVSGITAVYQGGVPNVGGVIGFGNRMSLPYGPKNGRWALNYGLRDHIYSQKLRNEPSLTQNFVILIGTQKYF